MPKTFYTEKDIEDLYRSGTTSLVVDDDVVVTDLGREKAMKLGFELVRAHDQPSSAPVRPYITKDTSPSAAPPASHISTPKMAARPAAPAAAVKPSMEKRVQTAVKSRLGDTVDPKLLETIIRRVLKNVGGK
ncbi:MAG: hypothetical protein ABFS17_04670 [Chloroflexota bacterium]